MVNRIPTSGRSTLNFLFINKSLLLINFINLDPKNNARVSETNPGIRVSIKKGQKYLVKSLE